jgi:SAM-dependent methyltransferase
MAEPEEPEHVGTTRAAYDAVAADYAELLRDELTYRPFDRAMLSTFAELVQAGGNGPVADIGCGPGRVTAYLHELGLNAFGIDLSAKMIAVARRTHPGLRFDEGSMAALDLADASVAGVVAWYSIIHTPREELPAVFAEFHRVLGPGGHLLLAFQAGDECVHLERAYGHDLALDAYRLPPEMIADLLGRTDLAVLAQLQRAAGEREKTPQAYLLARK